MAGESANRVTPQAGVLEGVNPMIWNASSPITVFIVQAGIIIIFCRLLHYPLSLVGQPRVIAEVLGGILLGPSVMMRIPNFQATIFPAASMPVLSNVANLGLILFLFLVALELDTRLFVSNWRVAMSVGLAGMVLPFGLGCAIAWGLFNNFHDDGTTVPISFAVYALFIGTALAITAFPVLCRILSELKLLETSVGVTVLAAGISNDVTGWILLALCVALVNNGSGIAALYVLLCCLGWILFLVFAVRPVFHWILKRSGSIQNGPSQGMVALTLLLVLTSAWFTGIIGVHPIFGAFVVGLICPHEEGFAIKLTEKIEDLVSVLFLPLYFAFSGLSTNLGLLNDGITWGYVIGVISIAFAGKIIGGTLAARACRLVWRESLTIGVLMSCKGLVELIVLNIGLQAKILSQKTFTIFVVMALVTTVSTTPLTKLLFPPWYQKKLAMWKNGEIDWDGNMIAGVHHPETSAAKLGSIRVNRLLVQVRLDALPLIFNLLSIFNNSASTNMRATPSNKDPEDDGTPASGSSIEVRGLRIFELTERTSSVMHGTEVDEIAGRDPVIQAFTTFSRLQSFLAAGHVAVTPAARFAETIVNRAVESSSDFVLVPLHDSGTMPDGQAGIFGSMGIDTLTAKSQLDFVAEVFRRAVCNTGVFINDGFGGYGTAFRPKLARTVSGMSIRNVENERPTATAKGNHIVFPFIGGRDDRLAARITLQMAENPAVSVTMIHFRPSATEMGEEFDAEGGFEASAAEDAALFATLRASVPYSMASRVNFDERATSPSMIINDVITFIKESTGGREPGKGDFVVVGRRHANVPEPNPAHSEMRNATGLLAESIVTSAPKLGVLVIQSSSMS